MRSVVRAVVTFATLVAVWLVVSPAQAFGSAPVCDPRGATMFAPPPQIQDEERSIDIVDCGDTTPLDDMVNVGEGRTRASIEWSASSAGTLGTPPVVGLCEGVRLRAPEGAIERLPRGTLSSVERPPRA